MFIMSVLATGLPSMNLEAHYQTLLTGIIVIGAVLLDMYRNRKASEVHIETAADAYKDSMAVKIAEMKAELAAAGRATGNAAKVAELRKAIYAARTETAQTFARMKREEKAETARIKAEERAADREFAEMLKKKAPS